MVVSSLLWLFAMYHWFRRRKILHILILSMILVAVAPIVFLALHVHSAAWDSSWREIEEKHKLLAQNQTFPLMLYINDHRNSLTMLTSLIKMKLKENNSKQIQALLEQTRASLDGFLSISYVDIEGHLIGVSHESVSGQIPSLLFLSEKCFVTSRRTAEFSISGIKASPFTGQPTIIMGVPVMGEYGLTGVLLGELRVSLIERLRRQIKFGDRGHSAIVDNFGKVIAHPNHYWMESMHDLSGLEIVKLMMEGESGVTEFYSPYMNETMVAGYSVVPGLGWGIMVPQPKSEIEDQIYKIMFINFIWLLCALFVAIIIAVFLARWIARPINALAGEAQILVDSNLHGALHRVEKSAPKEILGLSNVITTLVNRLQESRNETKTLNDSLQRRIDDATEELRVSNQHLEKTTQIDFLTSLANRRFFEQELQRVLHNEDDMANLCLLLLDIDDFKSINDKYGHVAGDMVLSSLANVLQQHMRETDLVARYAGDEFVARMRCKKTVAYKRAEIICKAISNLEIAWHDEIIHVTSSIGVYCMDDDSDIEMKTILSHVDSAMYRAKSSGRNCVVEFSL